MHDPTALLVVPGVSNTELPVILGGCTHQLGACIINVLHIAKELLTYGAVYGIYNMRDTSL